ncbi:MAG: trypsin-like peptidase domain-containing protein [Campylobacterales bacterium]|nr:trypsin-like peptidase domain-containing protein [Campylobacterales bacterium]
MRLLFLLLFASIAVFAHSAIKESIVKIYTTAKVPNYAIPWNSSIKRAHGSGSVISGNRILTNAHVVANETFIEVKRYGETKRYEAEVEYISHQVDLALLKVKDESFFDGVAPLEIGELPDLQQNVSVYGFPMGGNALSVTAGVVSRIEHTRYAHSQEIFLAIQIDAAINPGNSGGPAISDGKIVGVVMQQIKESQNIGYLVPSEIVQHFLKDVEDGVCNGFANLGVGTQNMQSETLRDVYKMSEEQSGVMVLDVSENSSLFTQLLKGDILLKIDGHKIENDATVEFFPEQFTSFVYYVDKKQIGEKIELEILRDGVVKDVKIVLNSTADDELFVKTLEHDVMPRYFIYGGYVFTPLTRNLLASYRSTPLQLSLLSAQWAKKEKQEGIVLLKVLADKSNRGDHHFSLWVVDSVNDKVCKNFEEFVETVQNEEGKYIILKNEDGVEIAIETKQAKEVTPKILWRYSIREEKQL